MDEEHNALLENNTWDLIPNNPNINLIRTKWIFKIKRKANGSIERYKAGLVAQGFKQHKDRLWFSV